MGIKAQEGRQNKTLLKDLIEDKLNPLQDNALKTVKKIQKEQITDAMSQGVPAENILSQMNIPMEEQQDSPKKVLNSLIEKVPASSPFGFGGMRMENGQMIEQKPGIIAGLLSTLLSGSPSIGAELDLNKLMKVSELQGKQQDVEYFELQKQREARLGHQYELEKVKQLGGVVSENMTKDDLDFTSMIEGLGLIPKQNSKTGEYEYIIPNMSEKREMYKRQTVSTSEMEYLDNYVNLVDSTDEIVTELQKLGVVSLSDIGEIEWKADKDLRFGPFSLPARINLFAQFEKDPRYAKIKDKIERYFQVSYRKPITASQASAKELHMLRGQIASFTQRPQIMLADLQEVANESQRTIDNRLQAMKAAGRNTSKWDEYIVSKRNKSVSYRNQQTEKGGQNEGQRKNKTGEIKQNGGQTEEQTKTFKTRKTITLPSGQIRTIGE